jgi:outer membrane protein TolC
MRPERARRVPAIAWLVAGVPMPAPEPVESAPPQLVSAADLRRDAFGECQVHEWAACLADLDRARAIDPAGDAAPAVKDARARAIAGIVSNKPPMPKP